MQHERLVVERLLVPSRSFRPHTHDEFVLSLNAESVLCERIKLDRQRLVVGSGSVTAYNPDQVQSSTAETVDGVAWECMSIYAPPSVVASLTGRGDVEFVRAVVADTRVVDGIRMSTASRKYQEVVLAGNAGNAAGSESQTAYIATGSHGLAIVDATQFRTPVVLSQLDLDGTAGDYLRFCQMLLDGGRWNGQQVFKPETVAAAIKPGKLMLDRSMNAPVRGANFAARACQSIFGVELMILLRAPYAPRIESETGRRAAAHDLAHLATGIAEAVRQAAREQIAVARPQHPGDAADGDAD